MELTQPEPVPDTLQERVESLIREHYAADMFERQFHQLPPLLISEFISGKRVASLSHHISNLW